MTGECDRVFKKKHKNSSKMLKKIPTRFFPFRLYIPCRIFRFVYDLNLQNLPMLGRCLPMFCSRDRRKVRQTVHAEYTPRSLAGFGVTGVDCMSGKLDFTETFTDFEYFFRSENCSMR